LYSERRPPDPSQVPATSKHVSSSREDESSALDNSSQSEKKAPPPKRGVLSFVDSN
jgi:hypothetical protein